LNVNTVTAENTNNLTITLPAQTFPLVPPTITTTGATQVNILTAGALTLNSNITNSANGGNNGGGVVTIQSSTLTLGGTRILTASGAGTGNGGLINVTTTSNTAGGDFTLDSGGTALNLIANSGATSGNGGIFTISGGRNLTFNTGS